MATKREAPSAPGVRASAVIKWCAFGGGDPPPTAPADVQADAGGEPRSLGSAWGEPGNVGVDGATLTAHYEANRAAVDELARAAGMDRPWCLDEIDRERERERQVRCRNSSEPP